MKLTSILILLVSFKALAFPLESKNGKSEFLAIGRPSAIKIVGHGAGPSGQLSITTQGDMYALSGEVTVDLESFETGIGLRDQHMKEKYLETGKSKLAILKFSQAPVLREILEKSGETQLPAVLQLHGVEKPVQVQTAFSQDGGNVKATSSFQIKITDFAIRIPSFSGMTMADQVQVKIETQIAKSDLISNSPEKK